VKEKKATISEAQDRGKPRFPQKPREGMGGARRRLKEHKEPGGFRRLRCKRCQRRGIDFRDGSRLHNKTKKRGVEHRVIQAGVPDETGEITEEIPARTTSDLRMLLLRFEGGKYRERPGRSTETLD